jgi:hypothetical protein
MMIRQNMKRYIAVLLLSVLSFLWGVSALGQNKASVPEQMNFSAEDENAQQPVSIPQDAWSVLKRDSSVLEVLASQHLSVDQLPVSWFVASEVHLDGPEKKDLVVIGKGLLQGANVTTFWVFAQSPNGLRLVLTLPAHDLSIEHGRTNGYKNIRMMVATAGRISTATLRFDGKVYRLHDKSTQKIN